MQKKNQGLPWKWTLKRSVCKKRRNRETAVYNDCQKTKLSRLLTLMLINCWKMWQNKLSTPSIIGKLLSIKVRVNISKHLRGCAACLEHFAIQRHCIWHTRHLQASSENASFCHVIPLIFPNCAHRILFCISTLESVLEVIFRLLNDTLIIFV